MFDQEATTAKRTGGIRRFLGLVVAVLVLASASTSDFSCLWSERRCVVEFVSVFPVLRSVVEQRSASNQNEIQLQGRRSSINTAPDDSRPTSTTLPKRGPGKSDMAISIGSEGYGTHVQQYALNGTGQQALQAIDWLNTCARIDRIASQAFEVGPALKMPSGAFPALIESMQQEQRKCQTITTHEQALRGVLAQRAFTAGEPGGALQVLLAQPAPTVAATSPDIIAALARDAGRGHFYSSEYISRIGQYVGFSTEDQRKYQLIAEGLAQRCGLMESNRSAATSMALRKLNAQDEATAALAAQQVLAGIQSPQCD